jgi:hypothetical protein
MEEEGEEVEVEEEGKRRRRRRRGFLPRPPPLLAEAHARFFTNWYTGTQKSDLTTPVEHSI